MTTLFIALDDQPSQEDVLRQSEHYLCHQQATEQSGQAAKTLLRLFFSTVDELVAYFEQDDSLAAVLVRASWEAFLVGGLLEARILGKRVASDNNAPQASHSFADWIRDKSGIGVAYVLAVFKPDKDEAIEMDRWLACITDLQSYTSFVNDVMSLRKEILTGDGGNYINIKTRIRHLSGEEGTARADKKFCIRDMLNESVAEAEKAANNIDALIEYAAPAKLPLWQAYRHGYIQFHLENPRYRLKNVAGALRGLH
ncbi:Terpenoid synthase [Ceraceosorus bombacis]|uniref:Terpenoid synthase n=1 Tax=Ceraceosorus bombacis TaxID=401625 RepID=A0A0P1BMN1_9BASI|nr:Terpenoid synthase [Ceraceosorus bombacis]